MSKFSIDAILKDLGESVTFVKRELVQDDWGDIATETTTTTSITAVVEYLDTEDEAIEAGIATPEDIRLFISEDDADSDYITENNQVQYDSKTFTITMVTKNKGHWEILARKQ